MNEQFLAFGLMTLRHVRTLRRVGALPIMESREIFDFCQRMDLVFTNDDFREAQEHGFVQQRFGHYTYSIQWQITPKGWDAYIHHTKTKRTPGGER